MHTKITTQTLAVNTTFHGEGKYEIHLATEQADWLLELGYIGEKKCSGRCWLDPNTLSLIFQPYAPSNPDKALVKDTVDVGAMTKVQHLKKSLRVNTTLPLNLSKEHAVKLYMEDALVVTEELGKSLYRPMPSNLSNQEKGGTNA